MFLDRFARYLGGTYYRHCNASSGLSRSHLTSVIGFACGRAAKPQEGLRYYSQAEGRHDPTSATPAFVGSPGRERLQGAHDREVLITVSSCGDRLRTPGGKVGGEDQRAPPTHSQPPMCVMVEQSVMSRHLAPSGKTPTAFREIP